MRPSEPGAGRVIAWRTENPKTMARPVRTLAVRHLGRNAPPQAVNAPAIRRDPQRSGVPSDERCGCSGARRLGVELCGQVPEAQVGAEPEGGSVCLAPRAGESADTWVGVILENTLIVAESFQEPTGPCAHRRYRRGGPRRERRRGRRSSSRPGRTRGGRNRDQGENNHAGPRPGHRVAPLGTATLLLGRRRPQRRVGEADAHIPPGRNFVPVFTTPQAPAATRGGSRLGFPRLAPVRCHRGAWSRWTIRPPAGRTR